MFGANSIKYCGEAHSTVGSRHGNFSKKLGKMKFVPKYLSALVLIIAVLFFAWPYPAGAQNKTFALPMSETGTVVALTFEPHGEVQIAAMLAPVQGKVAVCGFWTETKRLSPYVRTSNLLTRVRGSASIKLGNKTFLRNVSHFHEVEQDKFAAGEKASCVLTKHAWKDSYANQTLEVRVPRMKSFS